MVVRALPRAPAGPDGWHDDPRVRRARPDAGDRGGRPRTRSCLVCVATLGRSRSAAIVGSTFARIAAERAGPLVAVGPRVAATRGHADASGHLVVCLDGTAAGEEALPLGAAWARKLGWRITAVTAADHVLVDRDLESYLRDVARRPELEVLAVGTQVLWRMEYPHLLIGQYAERRAGRALVATTQARTGVARAALGSEVARIHRSPVPVLVQPSPGGDATGSSGRVPGLAHPHSFRRGRDDERRAPDPVHDGTGHAAHQRLSGVASAPCADDDHVGVHVVRDLEQRGRRPRRPASWGWVSDETAVRRSERRVRRA